MALTSDLHQLNHNIMLTGSTFQGQNLDRGSEGGPDTCWIATSGIPLQLKVELEGGSDEGTAFHQTDTCTSFQSSCMLPRLQQCEDICLTDWPLCVVHGGADTVSQKFDVNQCTSLQHQIYPPHWLSCKRCGTVKHYTSMELSNITSAKNNFIVCALHLDASHLTDLK